VIETEAFLNDKTESVTRENLSKCRLISQQIIQSSEQKINGHLTDHSTRPNIGGNLCETECGEPRFDNLESLRRDGSNISRNGMKWNENISQFGEGKRHCLSIHVPTIGNDYRSAGIRDSAANIPKSAISNAE
jgi:hypothetical protein